VHVASRVGFCHQSKTLLRGLNETTSNVSHTGYIRFLRFSFFPLRSSSQYSSSNAANQQANTLQEAHMMDRLGERHQFQQICVSATSNEDNPVTTVEADAEKRQQDRGSSPLCCRALWETAQVSSLRPSDARHTAIYPRIKDLTRSL